MSKTTLTDKKEREELKVKLVKRYKDLFNAANKKGVEYEAIRTNVMLLNGDTYENTKEKSIGIRTNRTLIKLSVAFLCIGAFCAMVLFGVFGVQSWDDMKRLPMADPCVVGNNGLLMEVYRPLMRCEMCRSLTQVPVESNITQESFVRKYAYRSVPVLIKNASSEWLAMSTFSYQFLKELYIDTEGSLTDDEECIQFFGYKTEFNSLPEVFNMSDDRANFKEGEKPWYIGWSNCHTGVQEKLRAHYQRPYFLPNDSESSSLDWIFMGGSGLGAFIHLDFVQRPSWQAQISGKKTWTLIPSPECESVCSAMNVTVHKGDIFVVDTNTWFHSTYIHPGEISITIGSEYD